MLGGTQTSTSLDKHQPLEYRLVSSFFTLQLRKTSIDLLVVWFFTFRCSSYKTLLLFADLAVSPDITDSTYRLRHILT